MVSIRLVLCAVMLFVAAEAARVLREDSYTTQYDNINLDEILKSDRLIKNYTNCLLDKGKCTPDGMELKEHIPDALTSECAKCSEKQKKGADKVLRFLIKNKADIWAELEQKYDPTGQYRAKYEKELKEVKESQ